MQDSYKIFLCRFGISTSDLIEFGLNQTLYPREDLVTASWEEAKSRLRRKELHWIRGAGRDATGTRLYQRFYELLLDLDVRKDQTNNAAPKRILEATTEGRGKNLVNYQVSHVFGRTKNPLLFTAAWNIVWKPKILDPFTGHEAKGEIAALYKDRYLTHIRSKYKQYLEDYEMLRRELFSPCAIMNAVDLMDREDTFPTAASRGRFLSSLAYELGPL